MLTEKLPISCFVIVSHLYLRLALILWCSCLSFPSAGIADMSQYVQLGTLLLLHKFLSFTRHPCISYVYTCFHLSMAWSLPSAVRVRSTTLQRSHLWRRPQSACAEFTFVLLCPATAACSHVLDVCMWSTQVPLTFHVSGHAFLLFLFPNPHGVHPPWYR